MSAKQLAEGKTKIIWEDPADPYTVRIESKDDITAGDGAKHDLLENKAQLANETTCNVFELLKAHDIATHFLGRLDERSFRAYAAEMIPLELVARRIATGSYLKRRPDVTEGTVFDDVIVEFFEKDDPNHDPLMIFDFASRRLLRYTASKPLGEGFMNEQSLADSPFADFDPKITMSLIETTKQVFTTLEEAWASQDVQLVDLKIECGWIRPEGGKPQLVVADVIDNDSWRIWPGGDKTQMKDKQVYRNLANVDDPAAKAKELGKIKKNYAWVAKATGAFSGK
jgi:phosphoribosylaminoimidazole-succinocarboxamide synthase